MIQRIVIRTGETKRTPALEDLADWIAAIAGIPEVAIMAPDGRILLECWS